MIILKFYFYFTTFKKTIVIQIRSNDFKSLIFRFVRLLKIEQLFFPFSEQHHLSRKVLFFLKNFALFGKLEILWYPYFTTQFLPINSRFGVLALLYFIVKLCILNIQLFFVNYATFNGFRRRSQNTTKDILKMQKAWRYFLVKGLLLISEFPFLLQ